MTHALPCMQMCKAYTILLCLPACIWRKIIYIQLLHMLYLLVDSSSVHLFNIPLLAGSVTANQPQQVSQTSLSHHYARCKSDSSILAPSCRSQMVEAQLTAVLTGACLVLIFVVRKLGLVIAQRDSLTTSQQAMLKQVCSTAMLLAFA